VVPASDRLDNTSGFMQVFWAGASDPGLVRRVNEDSYVGRPDLGLFVVADGMGGHAAGELASYLAVTHIESFVSDTARADQAFRWPYPLDPQLSLAGNRLKMAFFVANQQIAAQSEHEASVKGMATTASALLVAGSAAICAHIGDSRIYCLRGETFERVTRDHSWVEDQVRAGMLSDMEARRHPWRNVVTRALSGVDHPQIDIVQVEAEPGDRFLLCSDGLSGVVPDERVAAVLREGEDLKAICNRLVLAARRAGGPDNITAVVVELRASGDTDAA
jgi:serine/threonine protein phosphatase PrpC